MARGTPTNIITQGVLGDLLNLATQGFLEGGNIHRASGGLVLSGTGTTNIALAVTADGGLVVDGGTSGVSVVFNYPTDGGLVTDGSSGISIVFNPSISGGLVLGGTADIDIVYSPSIGGDIVSGGEADINITLVYSSTGGLTVAGDGDIDVVFVPAVGGDIVTGGDADINIVHTYAGTGGIVTDGSALTEYTIGIEVGGRGVTGTGRFKPHQLYMHIYDVLAKKDSLKQPDIETGGYAKTELVKAPKTFEFNPTGGIILYGETYAQRKYTNNIYNFSSDKSKLNIAGQSVIHFYDRKKDLQTKDEEFLLFDETNYALTYNTRNDKQLKETIKQTEDLVMALGMKNYIEVLSNINFKNDDGSFRDISDIEDEILLL